MDEFTNKITAESFWNTFQQKVNEQIKDVQDKWNNQSEFTDLILKKISNGVLAEAKYEDKNQYEYLRIDLIGWKKLNDNFGNLPENFNRHFWAFDVAIEHENNPMDWMDEVIKLSYINCPLRIVIGYSPKMKRDNYLDYVSKAMRILNERYQCVREGQDFMLILGDSGIESADVSVENYTPYLYDLEKGFVDKKKAWGKRSN